MRHYPLLLGVLLLSACSQDDRISIYRVAKEAERPVPAGPGPSASEQTAEVGWTVPAGWRALPASGMRLASFSAPSPSGASAEVSVVALPGDAGGDLANVNRWRGQLGLGPLDEAGLDGGARRLSSSAGELLAVDFANPGKGRMLAARLAAGGKTWFFKMTGSEEAVAAGAAGFADFLGSLRPARGSAAPPAAAGAAPGVRWTAPRGWKDEPASGMRLASYRVPVEGAGPAEVSVVSLPGDAGGDLANVNRWRGQLGLEPIDERGLGRQARRLSSRAGEVLLVDLAAPGKGRMLAARLFADGQSWFFKMTGEEKSVASAKPAFEGFLGSLRREAQ